MKKLIAVGAALASLWAYGSWTDSQRKASDPRQEWCSHPKSEWTPLVYEFCEGGR